MAVRDTPTTYSVEEAAEIVRATKANEKTIPCPRCDGQLESVTPFRRGDHMIVELCCPGCHRCVMVRRTNADY